MDSLPVDQLMHSCDKEFSAAQEKVTAAASTAEKKSLETSNNLHDDINAQAATQSEKAMARCEKAANNADEHELASMNDSTAAAAAVTGEKKSLETSNIHVEINEAATQSEEAMANLEKAADHADKIDSASTNDSTAASSTVAKESLGNCNLHGESNAEAATSSKSEEAMASVEKAADVADDKESALTTNGSTAAKHGSSNTSSTAANATEKANLFTKTSSLVESVDLNQTKEPVETAVHQSGIVTTQLTTTITTSKNTQAAASGVADLAKVWADVASNPTFPYWGAAVPPVGGYTEAQMKGRGFAPSALPRRPTGRNVKRKRLPVAKPKKAPPPPQRTSVVNVVTPIMAPSQLRKASPPTKGEIVWRALQQVRDDSILGAPLLGRWISASTWFNAVYKKLQPLSAMLLRDASFDLNNFNKGEFSRSLSRNPGLNAQIDYFDERNTIGVYRQRCQGVTYYHVNKWLVSRIELESEFIKDVEAYEESVCKPIVGTGPPPVSSVARDAATAVSAKVTINTEKRKGNGRALPAKRPRLPPPQVLNEFQNVTFWNSSEACFLFGTTIDDADVSKTLDRRIETFRAALSTFDGWRALIEFSDPERTVCSEEEVFYIRCRLQLLLQTYINAREHMTFRAKSFLQCCQMAMDTLRPLGNNAICHPSRIGYLNKLFRTSERFTYPGPIARGVRPQYKEGRKTKDTSTAPATQQDAEMEQAIAEL
ncbi:hypothetical protein MPSEU_000320600 [Mayamaea pseudoterrestris]|nr:hypothetical protein MPSEU_000320600 [Mayamaea pseudoterrestris]